MIRRRAFIAGLAVSFVAGPSVVRASPDHIVVTGDMGITGTALREIWRDREVEGVDIKRGPDQDILGNGNWRDLIYPGCTVVHMAIQRGFGWNEAEYCHQLNSVVLRECITRKAGRLIFTSSQMVNTRELGMGPLTWYAAEKLSMEARLRAAAEQGGLQVRILRLGSFAPGAPDGPRDWTRVNETTLRYWFDRAAEMSDASPIETWSVIGKTVRP